MAKTKVVFFRQPKKFMSTTSTETLNNSRVIWREYPSVLKVVESYGVTLDQFYKFDKHVGKIVTTLLECIDATTGLSRREGWKGERL